MSKLKRQKTKKTSIHKGNQHQTESEPRQWLRLYLDQQHEQLCKIFCDRLEYYSTNTLIRLLPESKHRINTFLHNYLNIFCQPDFVIPEPYQLPFISYLPTITNLLAISSFGNADPWLNLLSRQPANFVKMLTLYGPRVEMILEPSKLFEIDPKLASVWYMFYWHCLSVSEPESLARLSGLMNDFDPELTLPVFSMVAWPYFHPTYIDPSRDRLQKDAINRAIQRQVNFFPSGNSDHKHDIAVISSRWYPGSAVYKSISPFVKALAEKFSLVLIHCGASREHIDRSMFEHVIELEVQPARIDLNPLHGHSFKAVFYPDVGMTYESVILSNLRLAPVQVAGYGHPSSTWGSEIDYFLGGEEVELPEGAAENYSERLVLVPGLGAYPVFPEKIGTIKQKDKESSCVVNCSWGAMKANAPLLVALKEINVKAGRTCIFRFFPNWVLNTNNSFLAFRQDLKEILHGPGINFELVSNLPADQYMELLADGSFGLDSYPFGGYNTIVDSLLLGIPIVAWEGDHACNRLAAALLRRLGLNELIASSRGEYIELGARLIKDTAYRHELSGRVADLDLRSMLLRLEEAKSISKIFEYLINNHQQIQSQGGKEPIMGRKTI